MPELPPEEAPLLELGAGFRCNLKFAALVIVLLPVLVGLGFWQLWRADEKHDALVSFEAQRSAPPLPLASFESPEPEALDARRVELRGHYLPDRAFLLDNRIFRGKVGYELLMPFRDDGGQVVLVNRGWLQAPPRRETLPAFETPADELVLWGEFHVPHDRRRLDPMPTTGWPSVIQAIDVPALATHAQQTLFPFVVRLEPSQPGVTEADWPRVNMTPDRHRAYALQWFLMAAGLVLVFLFGGTNLPEALAAHRARRRQP